MTAAIKSIDLVDSKGNIREHAVSESDPTRTLCGIVIKVSQPPAENYPCGRCLRLELARVKKQNIP